MSTDYDRYRDPEKRRQYMKEYYQKHKEHLQEINKIPRKRYLDSEKGKAFRHACYIRYYSIASNRTKRALSERIKRTRIRVELLRLLGGKCCKCGFTDYRALQLDHINGGGTKERRSFPNQHTFVNYYWKNPELAKTVFQILCANCNFIKRYESQEVTSYDNYKEYMVVT